MIGHAKNMTAGRNLSELTVSAGLASGLLRLAVSKGADRAELLARAGIAPGDLEDFDNRIAFPKYVALMRAGKTLANDPALALHYGETNDLADISVVGLIAYSCETMAHVMAQLNRYGRLVVEIGGQRERWSMQRNDKGLWMVDGRPDPNAFHEMTESTMARGVCGPRRFGVTQVAKAIHVTHKAPAYRAEYERVLGCPVTFEAQWNAILVEEKWLTHKIALQPRYAFGIFAEHADALLARLETSKTARGRVESLLIPILHTGDVGIDTIADKLGVHRATLFKQLKEEGTTFKNVLDELRHRFALDYLKTKKVSVNETAYLVGFSEPAAFSRAFKRWTGSSPRAVRQADA